MKSHTIYELMTIPNTEILQSVKISSVATSDVTAWLGLNTPGLPGLGSALMAQGFKNMKPKP